MGFRYIRTLNLFYEDTGWTEFRLYELAMERYLSPTALESDPGE